jgi:hypothetical protein
MKTLCKLSILSMLLAGAILATSLPSLAQDPPSGQPVLLGTTGACNNVNLGGPCTETSMLVQIDPLNGALVRVIGPVGYTVNGLAWDPTTDKLYATTAVGDVSFHGLITIDPDTGAGTPVNPGLVNFGLDPDPRFVGSPIHSISIDSHGNIVGWYDEFPPPLGVTDTFVRIDKATGVATEFENTGLDTSQNGLAFAKHDLLWNIDAPKFEAGVLVQTAYLLDPANGQQLDAREISPPTSAALGDFNPVGNEYYGLNFDPSFPASGTFIVVINLKKGKVTTLGQTVDGLHTLAFIRHLL